MNTQFEQSFGVVPLYRDENSWQTLLIEQYSNRGPTFWGFPKGHAEAGENGESAALRELAEESGLTTVKLLPVPPKEINYEFVFNDIQYKKTALFYVAIVENKDVTITQPEEISSLLWCSTEKALTLLTHNNSKIVLEWALKKVI